MEPIIETGLPIDVGLTEATLEAVVPEAGSWEIKEYGIRYGEEADLKESLKVGTTPPVSSFQATLTGLYAGQTYFYQAYVKTANPNAECLLGDIQEFTTLSPEIHKVTPSEFVFPGDTVLVEGIFFSDATKANISLEKYEPYLLKDSDIIRHTHDSIEFVIPDLAHNERLKIRYEQKDANFFATAEYDRLIFPEPTIIAVNPSVVYDTQTVITLDVGHLNPRSSKNKIAIGGYPGFPVRDVAITTNQIKFRLSKIPSINGDQNCNTTILISNGGTALFTFENSLTYGIQYEVEDIDGNSLKTVAAQDTVVFKMAKNYNMSHAYCDFMFGEDKGDYIAERIDGDTKLFFVQAPTNLSSGKIQVRIVMKQACSAITNSDTEVEVAK